MYDDENENAESLQEGEDIINIDTQNQEQRKLYNDVNDVNRQLQIINHINVYSTEEPGKLVTVVFVIQNMFAMIEIQYNIHDKHPTKIRVFQRLTSDIF